LQRVAFNEHFSSAEEIGIDHLAGDDRDNDFIIADGAAPRRFSE
jgi:hypothetical protein